MVEGDLVDLRAHETRREERSDLGGDRDPAAVAAPVERLDAEVVARRREALLAAGPEREGEDAVQLLDAARPALLV